MLGLDVPSSDEQSQETLNQQSQVFPDSCNFRNPSESQFTPHIDTYQNKRSAEPMTPLVVNDFNENNYDELNELKLD